MDKKLSMDYLEHIKENVAKNNGSKWSLMLEGKTLNNIPIFNLPSFPLNDPYLPLPCRGKDVRIILPNGNLVLVDDERQSIVELANKVISQNDQWSSLAHFLEINYDEAPAFLVTNCSCLVINPAQRLIYDSHFSTAFTDFCSKLWLYAVMNTTNYFPLVDDVAYSYSPETPGALSEFARKMMAK